MGNAFSDRDNARTRASHPIAPVADRPVARWSVRSIGLCLFLITTAVNLQAPLYPVYARASHMGTGAQTLAFACYVIGLVPTLMFLGGLSDRIGRKLPLLIALILTATATTLPMIWPRLEAIGAARGLCGIAMALMAGSGAQYLVELLTPRPDATARAARIVAAATSLGFGCGSLATGLYLLLVPSAGIAAIAPASHAPDTYAAYLVLALTGMLLLTRVPRLPSRQPAHQGAGATPVAAWFRTPAFPAEALPHSLAILIGWSAVGVVIALVPTALAAHGHSAWSGFATFFVTSTGLAFQPLARKLAPQRSLAVGLPLVPIGFSVLVAGVDHACLPLLLTGALLTAAACYGFLYLGGLAAVAAASTDANRARASSGYFLFAYFGFSVPVVVSGALAQHFGVRDALLIFDGWLVLGTLALGALLLSRRKSQRRGR